MHHRRIAAAILGLAALTLSACGSSGSSTTSGSDKAGAGNSSAASSGASAGSAGAPTDKEYCDALSTMPDSSKYKTLGDAMNGLNQWATKIESLGTPADMPADAASAAKTFPAAMVSAMNSALGGLDKSTPISEVQKSKDLEKKFDAAIAPMEKTLGDGSPFDKWSSAKCG